MTEKNQKRVSKIIQALEVFSNQLAEVISEELSNDPDVIHDLNRAKTNLENGGTALEYTIDD